MDATERRQYADGLRFFADLIELTDLPMPHAAGEVPSHERATGPITIYVHNQDDYERACSLLPLGSEMQHGPTENRPEADDLSREGRLAGLHVKVQWLRNTPAEVPA